MVIGETSNGAHSGPTVQSDAFGLLEQSAKLNEERANRVGSEEEGYNMFEALSLADSEVGGHSRFLWHLLSPNGSHGMGDAFLRAFFQQILDQNPGPWLSVACVGREVTFPDGRMDILIEHPNECCVIVEVKIHAKDGLSQLERYGDYLQNWKAKNPRATLAKELYLTLDGHEASESSTGESQLDYECLSFKNDILPWLESCMELAKGRPRVVEAIRQYYETVEGLTEERMMDEECKRIAGKISESQTNYEAAVQIADVLPQVRTTLLERVFSDIEAHLKERLPEGTDMTTCAERDDVGKFYLRDERRRPWPRLKFRLREDDGRILALVVELDQRLWIGIAFFARGDNEWGIERIDADREWLYRICEDGPSSTAWKKMVDNVPEDDWWIDWQYLESMSNSKDSKDKCTDFRYFTTGEYASLFDPSGYDSFINRAYKGIDGYLKKLEALRLLSLQTHGQTQTSLLLQ